MKDDPFAQEYKETIDADAVCGSCGRVNPEGTLICKGCGNNLRDQRLLRLAADQMLTGEEESVRRRSWLSSGLTILGILVVIWFGLNAGRIMGMVTPGSVTDATGASANMSPAYPAEFWESGKDGFDALAADLKERFPTENDAETARLNPPSNPTLNGYFALFDKVGTTEHFVGAARTVLEDQNVRLVATFTDGTEARCLGKLTESSVVSVEWQAGGVLREGKYYAGAGSAVPQTDGTYQIMARSEAVPRALQAVAYPMGSH